MKEGKIPDYRDSHILKGKGKIYHESFEIYPFRKYSWEWEKKQLESILNKNLKKGVSILDFACGTGRVLEFLSSHSKSLTGLDLSDSMLEICKKNLPEIEVIKADITKENVLKDKRSFDIITAFRFFLNAQNSLRIDVLKALHPLLKDDGIFIFNNHGNAFNLGTFLGRWYIFKNIFRKSENRIYNYHTLSEKRIKLILKQTGYEIIETFHRGVLPIMNEKTAFNISKLDYIENWFSSKKFFRPIARNIIYVCRKKT